jgi:protein-S-isoprenylcysteine O-methyltransferase Ste14
MASARSKYSLSDLTGFVCFLGLTIFNLSMGASVFLRTPAVAIFLVPTFLHDFVITVAFLVRRPLRKQVEGWIPRIVAYAATFIIPGFAFIAGRWEHGWMKASPQSLYLAGVLLWIIGAYTAGWSLFRLRRSFSIVPQARALVISGPYRFARHPVYTGYVLQYGGLTLAYLTPALWAVFLVWWGILMLRISYEETVLSAAFPEYEAYKRRVGRFMPRILNRFGPQAEKTDSDSKAKGAAAKTSPSNLNLLTNLSGD